MPKKSPPCITELDATDATERARFSTRRLVLVPMNLSGAARASPRSARERPAGGESAAEEGQRGGRQITRRIRQLPPHPDIRRLLHNAHKLPNHQRHVLI